MKVKEVHCLYHFFIFGMLIFVSSCDAGFTEKAVNPDLAVKRQTLDCGRYVCTDEYNGRRYRYVSTSHVNEQGVCRHRKIFFSIPWGKDGYDNGLHYFLVHTKYSFLTALAHSNGPTEAWDTGWSYGSNGCFGMPCIVVTVPSSIMMSLFGNQYCSENSARSLAVQLQLERKSDYRGIYSKCSWWDPGCEWKSASRLIGRNDLMINFYYWGHSSPHPGIVPDNYFRVRWDRYIYMQEGLYRFYAKADDGLRVLLRKVTTVREEITDKRADSSLAEEYSGIGEKISDIGKTYGIINAWRNQVAEFRPEVCLSTGKYHIVIDYYENTEGAQMVFKLNSRVSPYCGNSGGGTGGSAPPGTHCIPRQIICTDKWHQRSCSNSGFWLAPKHCPNGCFQNQCNFCTLGSTRCKDITTEQRCAPDGKSYTEKQCIHRCMNNHCVFQVPCKPNQQVCKDTGVLLTCSSDGNYWIQTRCTNGCSHNQCRFCWPWTYRCKNSTTEQVCSSNGKQYIDQSCVHRCDGGRCMFKLPCKSGQRVCKDTSTQITCSSDGKSWIKTSCKNGCSHNQCNFCKPWIYRCKDMATEQVCSSDGTTYVDQCCIYRCDKGRCIYKVPCKSKQVLCMSADTQLTCSTDGQTWTKKSCPHGCGPWTCKPDPSSAQTCIPSIRRCINKIEVQLCMSDGSKWVPQYTCQNSCTEGICQNQSYQCTISFDSQARKMSIAGMHDVTYFSSSSATSAITDHTISKTIATIPQGHTYVYPRGTNNSWPYKIPRSCLFSGSIEWIERSQGGAIRIK